MLIKDLTSDAKANVSNRPSLQEIISQSGMPQARAAELKKMFYDHGPGNGTMLSLPFDQLVEHGIGHMLGWSECGDPRAVIELANKGDFSALALSIGQAEKYHKLIQVPLIVKVDGHFLVGKDVPYDRHSNMSSVQRAVEAGANAIGCTFYFGGKETMRDAERISQIIEESHSRNKPVFMWAYARGPLPEAMGADSLWWCAQAISAGESLGADVVKQKFPAPSKNRAYYVEALSKSADGKKGYYYAQMPLVDQLLELEPERPEDFTPELHVKRLSLMARVAPNTIKIISGGPKSDNEQGLLNTLKYVMDSGNEGQIVGRNLWGRPIDEALALKDKMYALMRQDTYKGPRIN